MTLIVLANLAALISAAGLLAIACLATYDTRPIKPPRSHVRTVRQLRQWDSDGDA